MAFNGVQTKKILRYVKKKYGAEPEFLWRKFPNNAVLRYAGNSKWFAALLNIAESKLGIDGKKDIEILDLRCDPMVIHFITDRKKIFPGYHMNKNHWVTLILDGRMKDKDVFNFIDASYDLTAGK